MEKLKELLSLCKNSVTIEVNVHKDAYETIEEYLEFGDDNHGIEPDVLSEMVKRDTLICVQAYPHTPIGFHRVYDYDIDRAIDRTLEAIKQ